MTERPSYYKLIHHCPACERGYEISIPRQVRLLPYAFVCPGCEREFEVRLAFLAVPATRKAAG